MAVSTVLQSHVETSPVCMQCWAMPAWLWDRSVSLGMSMAAAALWTCDASRHIAGIAWALALMTLVSAQLRQYYPFMWALLSPAWLLQKRPTLEVLPAKLGPQRQPDCGAEETPQAAVARSMQACPMLVELPADLLKPASPQPRIEAPACNALETREDTEGGGEEFYDAEPQRCDRQDSGAALWESAAWSVEDVQRSDSHGPEPRGESCGSVEQSGSDSPERPCPKIQGQESAKVPEPKEVGSSSRRYRSIGPLATSAGPWPTARPPRSRSCPAPGAECLELLQRVEAPHPSLDISTVGLQARRSTRQSRTVRASRIEDARRGSRLEMCLADCERELAELEARLRSMAMAPKPVLDESNMGEACEDAGVQAWRADCRELVRRLEDLAADALECSCNRDTIGAMDVFEQANAAMDLMAGLLRRCSDAEVEASAPEGCDPVEWRLAASSTSSRRELKALHALFEAVRDCETHPACRSHGSLLSLQPGTLLRFLRAKEGREEEAAQMFRASLDWRRDSDIESCDRAWRAELSAGCTWRARLVAKHQVHGVLGTDRLGLPVFLFRWSVFDIAGAERELGAEAVVQIILSIHEEVALAVRGSMLKGQAPIPGALYVWDVGNYGKHGVPHWWSRMWALVRFLPRIAKLLEANYPEMVRKIMVLRCGPTTKALYHAAAPLMPSKTLGKCRLYGWSAAEWLQDLRQELPACALPAFLERDDDAALAAAEPRGGLYPPGAAAAASISSAAVRCASLSFAMRAAKCARRSFAETLEASSVAQPWSRPSISLRLAAASSVPPSAPR
mmetsp:Transcript_84373/g.273165  ORF Transcript_84373/g.273165 Transcript_84373/m.273165 type:complete len:795 (-) Transcript_84373:260-2644(-)